MSANREGPGARALARRRLDDCSNLNTLKKTELLMNKFVTIGAVAVFGAMVAGCNAPTPAAKVQQNVANAKAERSNEVAEARREGAQDISAQRHEVSEAKDNRNYEVALAKAEGDYKVAKEACNVLAGSAQVDCRERADATLKSDTAKAELLKP